MPKPTREALEFASAYRGNCCKDMSAKGICDDCYLLADAIQKYTNLKMGQLINSAERLMSEDGKTSDTDS